MTERPYMPLDLAMRNDQKVAALEQEDPKLVTLWVYLLCMMYEEKGPLEANYKRLAYLLRFPSEEEVRHVVEDSGLFVVEDGVFWNASALDRIERKDTYTQMKREAGKMGGRPRKNTEESTPESRTKADQKAPEKQRFSNQKADQKAINQINKENKEINPRGRADAPTREEDDFLIEKFFFRNMMNPGREVGRCLEHFAGENVRSWEAVAAEWKPENSSPRFDDPRALRWARVLWSEIGVAAGRQEAAECLRHIDAITIDRGRNELRCRMRGLDWASAVLALVEDTPSLVDGFEKVTVTKRTET